MKAKNAILVVILSAFLIGAVTYYFLPSAYHNRTASQKSRYHFERITEMLKENPNFLEKTTFPENPYFLTKVMVVINKTAGSANDTLSVDRIDKLSEDNYLVYIKIPFEKWRERFEEEVDDYFYRHRGTNYALQSLSFLELKYIKGRGVVSAVVSRDFFVYRDMINKTPLSHRYNIYDAKGIALKSADLDEKTILGVMKMAQKAMKIF